MYTIEAIQQAVERLSPGDLVAFRLWLQDFMHRVEDEQNREAEASRVEEPRAAYPLARSGLLTLEEYDALEEQSPVRHEFINGVTYAMTGASAPHNRVAGNLFAAFHAHLRGGPCWAFMSDMQLYIKNDTDEIAYYPDVMVACDRERWMDNKVRDPKLVIEVLSPSTREIDRREKSLNYRRLASIEEYVTAAQDEHKLTIHRRSDRWRPDLVAGPDAVAEFRSIGLSLALAQIYEDALV